MRLLVAIDNRFGKTENGAVYSVTGCDYAFWSRFLGVFEEVTVFARMQDLAEKKLDKPRADGPGVKFLPTPMYLGPRQYLREHFKIRRLARQAARTAEAVLLWLPGTIATHLGHELLKQQKPFAVRVVGDPWDVFSPESVRFPLRSVVRRLTTRNLQKFCRHAFATSYVTEYTLQKRYPTNGWSTFYSSIDLPAEVLLDVSAVEQRLARITEKQSRKKALQLCCVGQMSVSYKAQDVLIEAVAECIRKGMNLELILLGDGLFRSKLEQCSRESGIADRVHFSGNVNKYRVFEILDESDLFVLPSRTEGLPRALIEAMARGLPCLGSAVGGIPELLEEDALVAPGDSAALAEKIQSVLANPQQIKRMALHNIQTAANYQTDILNQRREEFYRMIVELTKKHHRNSNSQKRY